MAAIVRPFICGANSKNALAYPKWVLIENPFGFTLNQVGNLIEVKLPSVYVLFSQTKNGEIERSRVSCGELLPTSNNECKYVLGDKLVFTLRAICHECVAEYKNPWDLIAK